MMNRLWWLPIYVVLGSLAGEQVFGQVYHTRFTKQECQGYSCRLVEESGSAVCLGELDNEEWLLVTVAHGTERSQRVDVAIPDEQGQGRWQVCKVLATAHDDERDLSLLSLRAKTVLKTCRMSVSGCERGAEVQLLGFPITGFRRWNSRLRSENTVVGLNQQGESGGAVLFGGELIGIQWGHSPSEQATYFTPVRHVRTLVRQHVRLKESQQLAGGFTHINSPCKECVQCQECLQMKQDMESLRRELAEAVQREKDLDRRVVQLEPLLKRRVILETEKGEVTADRVYGPEEAIRLRSIYRSQVTANGKVPGDK